MRKPSGWRPLSSAPRARISRTWQFLAASTGALMLCTAVPGQARAPADAPRPVTPPAPTAPAGAPNILLVLLDDVGFAATSTFGGAIPTPNYDALAEGGLRYNRYHSTAMCSPTRAALLTGRNPHRVNMGSVVNVAVGEPGYTSVIPKSAATIGRVLQLHGYSTAWIGKNHLTPEWEITSTGPFQRWPNAYGFDFFYGFMNGAVDQWSPQLVMNNRYVDPPARDDYILDVDLADRLIEWVQQNQSINPDRPFLAYLAPGTAHEPHQAPSDWVDRFRGKFDQGWDSLREQTFARQKAMGIIPANAVLTPRPDAIPTWSSLTAAQQQVAARMMEVHAAQLAHFDAQLGRIVAALKETGEWNNTLVVFLGGDNGASAEGGPYGAVVKGLNRTPESTEYQLGKLDQLGGPRSSENYPAGWAWAMNTPFRYFKQIASHLGGLRDSMVISWPGRIERPGGVRSQFAYVTDIAPTIYEAVGISVPAAVDGVAQMPLDGTSLLYSFNDPAAPSRHTSQYFEMLGNRAFYKDGWLASTTPPKVPWEQKPVPPVGEWNWELYNLSADYSQSLDLASANSAKLNELKVEFERAEKANNFRTLPYGLAERVSPWMRPYPAQGRSQFTFYPAPTAIPEETFPDIKNREWSLSASVTVAEDRASGTILAQGGWPHGWGLFLFDGRPTFIYRNEPLALQRIALPERVGPGQHVITVRVKPEGPGQGAAAAVSLAVDGGTAASLRLPATVPAHFGFDGVGIGRDVGTTIVDDYRLPFAFPGTVHSVDLKRDGAAEPSAH